MLPTFTTQTFSTAQEYLDACAPALEETRATSANLHIASAYTAAKAGPNPDDPRQWWLAVSAPSNAGNALFTLTVLGTLPGGLCSSVDPKRLGTDYVKAAMQALADLAQAEGLLVSRLFSVCAPRALAAPFVDAWAAMHNLTPRAEPVMHMYHSRVTKNTLRPPIRPKVSDVRINMATMDDLDAVADMLVLFSHELPSSWDIDHAKKFAAWKIEEGVLFTARVSGELKAIAATARPTPGVKAVSQVFTDPACRGKGLAELITREVVDR
jgi:hypothetical protein